MFTWTIIIAILVLSGSWRSYFIYFIILYFAVVLFNLLNNSNNVLTDENSSILEMQGQDSFVQGTISMYILVFVFLDSIKIPESEKYSIYKLLLITLMISATSLFIYNYKNDTRNIRLLRKAKEFLFNQSLAIFFIALFMIFKTQKPGVDTAKQSITSSMHTMSSTV